MKSNRPPIEDFFSGKHHVAALATAAGIDFPRQPLTPSAAPFFGWQEGHSASAGNIEHGWTARFGLLNLSMVKSLGIEGKVYAGLFAILPEKLTTDVNRRRFSDFGLFPAALRNLGLVVPTATPAVDVQKALAKAARAVVGNAFALEIVGVFDVYPGKGLPEGTKSRAFSLVFRAADRTLSDDEVNAVFTKTQQSIVADGKTAVGT